MASGGPARADAAGACVQSGNLGRHAVLAAGLPESVPAVTIDRQCGSGQQAVSFAAQAVMAGSHGLVIACGVESMSRVPMPPAFLPGAPLGPQYRGSGSRLTKSGAKGQSPSDLAL